VQDGDATPRSASEEAEQKRDHALLIGTRPAELNLNPVVEIVRAMAGFSLIARCYLHLKPDE
jgi:hypothetical protein